MTTIHFMFGPPAGGRFRVINAAIALFENADDFM